MKPLLDVLVILDALEKKAASRRRRQNYLKRRPPSVIPFISWKTILISNCSTVAGIARDLREPVRCYWKKAVKCCTPFASWKSRRLNCMKAGRTNWSSVWMIPSLSLLAPLIDAFYQRHSVTRLKFVNGVLGGSWETLTQGRADIIVGAMRAPPPDTGFGFARLGDLELVFAVAPHHPLVHEEEPLSRQTIKRFRAIVVGDSVHSSRSIGSELLDAQEAITVFDFKTKLELQISGLGCGYLPRYLAQRFLESGALIEKKVVAQIVYEPVWVGWNEQTAGLASGWWRDEILANNAIAGVYAKSPV